jgi:hypothetical protein
MKKIILIVTGIILVLSFFLCFGCTSEKDQKLNPGLNESIMEKHKRDMQKKQDKQGNQGYSPLTEKENMMREKQAVSAEACQKEFESCVERCKDEDCEKFCLDYLDACEKNLSKDVQTLKKD